MRWYQEVGVHGSESIDDFRDEKILEAKEFTSTQRQQVNPRHLQEIHLLALRAGIANACPVSKSALP